MMTRLLVTLAVASGLIAAALLQPAFAAQPTQVRESKIGPVLTDPQGQTLYTFDKDPAGQSACEGECAENWPPFLASDGDQPEGDYTLVTRADGGHQWAYKGKPLYTMSDDSEPGDTNGDGKNDVWHAAHP